jgi:hypothetical protein
MTYLSCANFYALTFAGPTCVTVLQLPPFLPMTPWKTPSPVFSAACVQLVGLSSAWWRCCGVHQASQNERANLGYKINTFVIDVCQI